MIFRFLIKPAIPAMLCVAGFLIGGILGMFEPMFGFGWGGITGAVFGGLAGKFVQDALSQWGL